MGKNDSPVGQDSLAWRLRSARKARGWTQGELAKAAHLNNQSIIGMLESGARKSTTYIVQIAAALGVDPAWLQAGVGTADLLPSSSIQSEQSEVIFTSDNVAAPAFAEPRRWPFSPELHERIMRMGAEEIADLESSLDNHVGLIEARLSRAASTATRSSKRAS
jgi:transcriptional regulator with XRE-family HTH domain